MTHGEALKKIRALYGNAGRAKASGKPPYAHVCRVGRVQDGKVLWTGRGGRWEVAFTNDLLFREAEKKDREKALLKTAASWAERDLLRSALGHVVLDGDLDRAREKVEYDRAHPDLLCSKCGRKAPCLDMRNEKGLGLCCYGRGGGYTPPIRKIRRVGPV